MEDNKWKKDVADPDINIQGLNQLFDVNTETGEMVPVDDIKKEVADMRETIKAIESDIPDVDGIIYENIQRANRFLDKIEDHVLNGNISATMLEACATLINAVTSAATSITGISYNNDLLEIRREELRIREKKLAIESIVKPSSVQGDVNITHNTLTMTREELLRELRASDGE